MEQDKTRAKAAADAVLTFVNAYGYDAREFARVVAMAHPTLQQSTMRLFMETIRELAKVTPDGRNVNAVELAKKIVEVADGFSLPLI